MRRRGLRAENPPADRSHPRPGRATRAPAGGPRAFWAAAWLGPALIAIYLIALAATLPDYGVTWDEPEWFEVGDRQLRYFSAFDGQYLTMPPGSETKAYYGPLAAIASSTTGKLFHDTLGWLADDTARHVSNILFAALGAGSLWTLVRTQDGAGIAFLATLSFVALPRWFGHAHSNISDMPAAACFVTALTCLLQWRQAGSRRWLIAMGAAFGATWAIRPQTGIFLPVVVLLWFVVDDALRHRLRSRPTDLLLFTAVAPLFVYLFWPMFWTAPLDSASRVVRFFLHPPQEEGHVPVFYLGRRYPVVPPWHYPVVTAAVTTPLGVLGLASWGWFRAWGREGSRWRRSVLLAASWLCVSVGNHCFMLGNYDGERHFLEAFPALAWLAGIGAAGLVEFVSRLQALSPRRELGAALGFGTCLLLLSPSALAVARLHPYPQIFYNELAGGLVGGDKLFETDYWGFSVKRGMQWVNRELPVGATIAVPWGQHQARYYKRDDLEVVRTASIESVESLRANLRAAQGPRPNGLYYLYHARRGFISPTGGVAYVTRTFPKVFAITKDGVPLLEVYRIGF